MGNLVQLSRISEYYREYLDTIRFYSDYTRHSLFCIYLNIDTKESVFESNTKVNYSKHQHGVVFNSYEFTPVYSSSQLTNVSGTVENKSGLQFDGSLTIVTYTIPTPRLNDIVIFPYEKSNVPEIYRVNEVSVALSTANADQNYYFNLQLEYAPNINTRELKIHNTYSYLLTKSQYLPKREYVQLLKDIRKTIRYLESLKFNDQTELYYVDLERNYLIYSFIEEYLNFLPFQLRTPYGVFNHDYTMVRDQISPNTIFGII